jgi:2-C-methyl-D-erythritol 4-phosphate cytidylyltransferase
MKKIALIVAAGNGSRMNLETPKQFLLLKKKPILYYTIQSFLNAYDDMEIILVLPEEHIARGQEIIDGYFDNSKFRFCAGGRTRFHSVQNGLSLIPDDEERIIFVHDGVRCLLTSELIKRCYENAMEFGTAIPATPCKDSVRIVEEKENTVLNRDKIKLIQTPQTFHSKILLPAFNIDYKDQFTDEATVVEAFGLKVHLVEGEPNNIKITTPVDLYVAEKLLEEKGYK